MDTGDEFTRAMTQGCYNIFSPSKEMSCYSLRLCGPINGIIDQSFTCLSRVTSDNWRKLSQTYLHPDPVVMADNISELMLTGYLEVAEQKQKVVILVDTGCRIPFVFRRVWLTLPNWLKPRSPLPLEWQMANSCKEAAFVVWLHYTSV